MKTPSVLSMFHGWVSAVASARTARPADLSSRGEDRRAYFLLLAPTVLVLLLITVFPLFFSLAKAFSFYVLYKPSAEHFVGLSNFQQELADGTTVAAFQNTLRYTAISVGIEVVLGFALALLFNAHLYGVGPLRTLLMIPILLSPVVVGLSWRFMYNPEIGIVDQVLQSVGLPALHWLEDPRLAFWAVMVPDIWQWTPFVSLVLLAGLHSISSEIQEAAVLDGLRLSDMVRYIYLPLLVPVLTVVVLLRVIDGIKTFDVVYTLTQGGPGLATMLLSIRAWTLGLINLNMGQASALSYLIVVLTSIFATVFLRLIYRREA
jgi:multiple sugar transport system permease protein